MKDTRHCAFFLKTGSCRFGDACGKGHPYPQVGPTILIKVFLAPFINLTSRICLMVLECHLIKLTMRLTLVLKFVSVFNQHLALSTTNKKCIRNLLNSSMISMMSLRNLASLTI